MLARFIRLRWLRRRRWVRLVTLSILAGMGWHSFTIAWISARPSSSAAAPPASAPAAGGMANASARYQRFCARCHGDDQSGKPWRDRGRQIPDFTSTAWQESRKDARLLASILEGKGTNMPAFAGKVTEAEARDLVLLIRARNSTRPRVKMTTLVELIASFAELERELEKMQKQFRDLHNSGQKPRKPER